MAIIRHNSPLDGAHGRFGNIILRRFRGRTIAAARPAPSRKEPSGDQLAQRHQFFCATQYARDVRNTPHLRQLYEQAGVKSVYATAVRDFLRPPKVTDVIEVEYEGNAGDPIRVYATDDTKVAGVTITIRNTAGETLESGEANDAEYCWIYRAKTCVARGTKVSIEATARDLADNTATLRKEVEI